MRREMRKLQEKVDMLLVAGENPRVVSTINEIAQVEDFKNLPLISNDDLTSLENEITMDAVKATSLVKLLLS